MGSQARTWIRQTGGPAAYLKMLRGRAHFQTFSPEGHAEAERIWRELLAEHPDQAYEALIGWILWQKVTLGLSKDPAADLREAKRLGELTVARHPHYAISYTMLGAVSLGLREHEDALAYAGRALELEPGGADANMIAGWINAASGRPGEGVDLMRQGMRYEPDYPHWLPGALGTALIMAGRYDEAESLARGVLATASEDVRAHPTALMHLAVTAELTGRHGEATEHVARLRELWPGVSLQGLRPGMSLFKDQDYVERRIDALRRAGVPEGA